MVSSNTDDCKAEEVAYSIEACREGLRNCRNGSD